MSSFLVAILISSSVGRLVGGFLVVGGFPVSQLLVVGGFLLV
jgi:hypothetical protein